MLRAVGASWETTRDYGIIDQLAPGAVDVPDPVAAAERFARHLAGLAGTVLVVVDDAHWADEASLQTLASTVRHHPRLRLLVVATAVEGDTRVPAGIGALLRRIATVEIPVEPLTAAEVAAVAASFGIVLSPPVADTLCRHTGGRVRYVRELLREVPRRTWSRFDPVLPAPAAVSARVRDLLADCSDAARRFVGAVAVLGPAAAVREAAALAELGDEEVLDAVDEACTAGLAVLTAHGPAEIPGRFPGARGRVGDHGAGGGRPSVPARGRPRRRPGSAVAPVGGRFVRTRPGAGGPARRGGHRTRRRRRVG